MNNSHHIIFVLSVVLFLITARASSQTVSDTASVATGTIMRGLPNTEPIKPQTVESNSLPLKIAKKVLPGKQRTQLPENEGQPNEIADYSDTMLANAYRNSLLAYYRSIEKRNTANTITFDSVTSYYSWALKNRQNIITRQQNTGSIIFILVVILVLSGLIFSAIQFYIALKSAKRKAPLPDTSLKASLSGVEVSSSVLGVIILTISIVFFYLYLTKVYPLVSLDQITTQSPK
jgi:hypothetical protein